MRKKTPKYTDNPELPDLDKLQIVEDFLPPPEQLVFKKSPTAKVTIVLRQESIDFFKKEADRLKTSYQSMIRNLLQEYTERMKAR